ncbi:hypothetical protein PCANC_23293 [Puccinia coronata f. sp. avenae]|uniref:Uncharacterized protein n=1 Tax=Puccinia coronata f. sp. avenae TaxID=200324 RepID=A0A2N5TMU4_9BASI|nr:hypothetical protein PCANC_23293 [Puccinia coronata f. sp. avenae]
MNTTGFTKNTVLFSVLASIVAKTTVRILEDAWTAENPAGFFEETWLGRNWYDGAHWEGSSYVIGKRDTQSHLEAKYLKGNDIRLYNGSKRQQTYTLLERHLSKEKVTERWLQRTIDPNDEHRVARSIKPVDESIYIC